MSRKKTTNPEPPQDPGAPAWMNTYGDMVTLILTFFVLLFSFSTVNAKKWEALVQSFKGEDFVVVAAGEEGTANAGNSIIDEEPDDLPSRTPGATDGNVNEEEPKDIFDELYAKLQHHIEVEGLEGYLNVERIDNVITLRIRDSALFDSGKDHIKEEALSMLDYLTEMFVAYESTIGMIRIEGHTDNIPISSARFQSNWDLSAARAVTVLQYLAAKSEISPAKFSAVGYGEFKPVSSNDTDEGRALNRRVDFVIESIAPIG